MRGSPVTDKRLPINMGDEVAFHSVAWGWRFGKVIGRHTDNLGINPSGLEVATVRFATRDHLPACDMAIPCFRLDRSIPS